MRGFNCRFVYADIISDSGLYVGVAKYFLDVANAAF